MDVHFGFSYIGCLFLILLMIPNLLWTKHKPKNYEIYAAKENMFLLLLERAGECLVTCIAVISSDFNLHEISIWSSWLIIAFFFMILYELFWIRYFKSDQTMADFYSSFLGIPIAGASLPVFAFLCLGIYGENLWLILAVIILGIGHIGIHWNHYREL